MADRPTSPLFSDFPASTHAGWLKKIEQDLKGKPVDRLVWKAPDGLAIQPVYPNETAHQGAGANTLPGEAPFRRGSVFHADEPGWQIVQPLSTAEGLSDRIREAADAETGAVLVDGNAPADVLALVPLSNMAIHLRPAQQPLEAFAALLEAMKGQPMVRQHLTGTISRDLIGEAALAGKSPSAADLDELGRLLQATAEFPYFRALGIDATRLGEEGASPALQLAFVLSATVEYLDRLSPEVASTATLAENLHVTFPLGSSFFLELAKFRAFRVLMHHLLQAYGLDSPGLLSPFVLARSSRRNLAHYDRHNNLLRHTTQAMAAVLGGAEAVVIEPFDVLDQPQSKTGSRLARNIQFLLKHESYLDRVQDPAGGSYYVEALTNELIAKGWETFQAIEAAGGLSAYASHGMLRMVLGQQAEEELRAFHQRKRVMIGVNQSAHPQETQAELQLPAQDFRLAASFERLRSNMDRAGAARGRRFRAFLWQFGDVTMRNARAQFCRNLLAAGGWEVMDNQTPDDQEASFREAEAASPELVVLCSADAQYAEAAPALVAEFKQRFPASRLLLAGKPEGWELLGVHACLFAGMDAYGFLAEEQAHWLEGAEG